MSGYDAGVGGATTGQGGAPARRPRAIDLRCDTCGATFAARRALAAHLVDAYHGFQCLHCGALFARRCHFDGHTCRRPGVKRWREAVSGLRVQVIHLMPPTLPGVTVAWETGGDKEAVVEERLRFHSVETGAP